MASSQPTALLEQYRQSAKERERENSLMSLVGHGKTALDIGALEGYYSRLLQIRYERVTALDLEEPKVPGCENVAGSVENLQFADRSFDLVFCSEVLEHVPNFRAAAREIARVARERVVIGVPYDQDTRRHRVTCHECRKILPPWGHVNSFDEAKLTSLFPGWKAETVHLVSEVESHATTAIAARLMDFGGNPWGAYHQDLARCGKCGALPRPPANRSLPQKVAGRIAGWMNRVTDKVTGPKPAWIHVLFVR
jgi:SAM-dependent methyltransferase